MKIAEDSTATLKVAQAGLTKILSRDCGDASKNPHPHLFYSGFGETKYRGLRL
jgi:hypothetical protein